MIDIHCHILPGLDDGPSRIEESLMMARLAEADGVRTIVATPHIRADHPFDLAEIDERVAELNEHLDQSGVNVRVVPGGEVALSKAIELPNETLQTVCLGNGPYILLESPYTEATDLLEDTVFGIQVRGFRPVLAHPERSPSFIRDPDLLRRLVSRGVLCSVTAGSMSGLFGNTVRRFTRQLFAEGMVHNVASDAHDARKRPPVIRRGFRQLDPDLPGLVQVMPWYMDEAASAIVGGRELPESEQAQRGPEPHRPTSRRSSESKRRSGLLGWLWATDEQGSASNEES